jgi:hypothetical protein
LSTEELGGTVYNLQQAGKNVSLKDFVAMKERELKIWRDGVALREVTQ